jgi:hypothetical protein
MKSQVHLPLSVVIASAGILVVLTGCASPNSRKAKPLQTTVAPGVDFKAYRTATMVPFSLSDTNHADLSVGAKLSQDIGDRLKYDFGDLFAEVRHGTPLGKPDEVIISGKVTKYKPGSKTARFMLAGLGAASLEGELVIKQGDNEQVVMTAPFDKLWAWGGGAGASKGIEEMLTEVAAASAKTIAQARGVTPKE